MTSLAKLQARLQHHIIGNDDAVINDIAGPDDEYRRERLQIYYRAYRLRLTAALASDYPLLKAFVGEGEFEALANAYIEARPSTVRNLRWFGDAMAGFLRSDSRFSCEAVLAELAEFEWAQGLAFDAADAPVLRFDELAAVPPDDWAGLRFIAHPSLRLVESRWNVLALWHAHRANTALPAAITNEHPAAIAVWRRDYRTYFRTLDPDEAWLWRVLAKSTAFGDACAQLAIQIAPEGDSAAQRAAQLLRTWIEEGWVQGFSIATED